MIGKGLKWIFFKLISTMIIYAGKIPIFSVLAQPKMWKKTTNLSIFGVIISNNRRGFHGGAVSTFRVY